MKNSAIMHRMILVHAPDAGITYLSHLHKTAAYHPEATRSIMCNGASVGIGVLLAAGYSPLEIMYASLSAHWPNTHVSSADIWWHDTMMGHEGVVDAHSLSRMLSLDNAEIDKMVVFIRVLKQWVQTGAALRWDATGNFLRCLLEMKLGTDSSAWTLAEFCNRTNCNITIVATQFDQLTNTASPCVLPATTTVADAMRMAMAVPGLFLVNGPIAANLDHIDQHGGAWTKLFDIAELATYTILQPVRHTIFPVHTETGRSIDAIWSRFIHTMGYFHPASYDDCPTLSITPIRVNHMLQDLIPAILQQLLVPVALTPSTAGETATSKGMSSPFSLLILKLFLNAEENDTTNTDTDHFCL